MIKINKGGITLEGATLDDVSVAEVIDKVKRAAVIDGDGVDGIGGTVALFSLFSFFLFSLLFLFFSRSPISFFLLSFFFSVHQVERYSVFLSLYATKAAVGGVASRCRCSRC